MAESQNNQPDIDDEIHLLDYLIVLVKHSRMIIFTSIAAMVLTYLVLLILPNKYTSMHAPASASAKYDHECSIVK